MEYIKYLPPKMAAWINSLGEGVSDITLISGKKLFALRNEENVVSDLEVTKNVLNMAVEKMCRGSIYASQSTLKYGYLSVEGERVGVAGLAVTDDDGAVTHMRNITALNIRVPREIKGAADEVMPYIMSGTRIYNTIIISPPSRGKTTILRDAARQCGNIARCAIADERFEIAGKYDVGQYTTVIEGCSKAAAINMLLRSMAPSAIFTDEIGSAEDEEAIGKMMNAGVKIVCTAHGYDEKDVMRRRAVKKLFDDGIFERVIVLSSSGRIGGIQKAIRL